MLQDLRPITVKLLDSFIHSCRTVQVPIGFKRLWQMHLFPPLGPSWEDELRLTAECHELREQDTLLLQENGMDGDAASRHIPDAEFKTRVAGVHGVRRSEKVEDKT